MDRNFSTNNNADADCFHEEVEGRAYEYFGAHKLSDNGVKYKYVFRAWFCSANSVELTGDFNSWGASQMTKISESGIWEIIYESDIPLEGMRYKYRVIRGTVTLEEDPFARYSEHGKKASSIIYENQAFEWHDKKWLAHRAEIFKRKGSFYEAPMNIYELDLASWKTRGGKCNSSGDAYLNYRELANELENYASRMGYTHVELIRTAEKFSPTSKFGTPEDFRCFVDIMHKANIGVILEWNGVSFFCGKNVFFDAASLEARSFVLSNALFWFREFHVDGLRIKNAFDMISLSSAFVKKLNAEVFSEFFDVLMIADESAACPKVSSPVELGGLGFNLKWNMGWANDVFSYISTDPYFRSAKHNALTFSLMYAFSENYILPISESGVSGGKKSLIDKVFGGYEDKFACVRAFLGYMMSHPGKKLTFMGSEFGQIREWDPENQLEWFLSDLESHKKLSDYVRALNACYSSLPPLWEKDFSQDGFEWIYSDRATDNLIAFKRKGRGQKEVICIVNFSPVEYKKYGIRVGNKNTLFFERINSDSVSFGGCGRENRGLIAREGDSIYLDIPPLSSIIIEPVGEKKTDSQEVDFEIIKN